MFALRSLFWLGTLTMLLPPAPGQPPPRVGLLHTAYSVRILLQDITGVCGRNPEACAASRDALVLLASKVETGAGILSAGIAAGHALSAAGANRGTLRGDDLQPAWGLAELAR